MITLFIRNLVWRYREWRNREDNLHVLLDRMFPVGREE